MITISKQSIGTFNDNWKKCIGTGHMGLALQNEYLEHLEMVQDAIGFEFIRGHGILSDHMGLYRERLPFCKGDREFPEPFLNFTYIDRVFDSYLDRGIKPFIELGFMPNHLASGSQTQFYWKGNVTPPKDYAKWSKMITGLIKHLLSRYGKEALLDWPVEVWNEPNLPQFWQNADQAEYFRLYRETVRAVKEVDSDIQVGGPATAPGGGEWVRAFLEYCSDQKIPLDFAAHHVYASKVLDLGPHLGYHDLRPIEHLAEQFSSIREIMDSSPYSSLPLHITEYNSSYNPLAPVHDTPLNAAYIAHVLAHGGDFADSFSYWTFSDVFEELDIPKSIFHGGFGLIALGGIPKPTFHTFAFFAELGKELLYRDAQMIVTRNDKKEIVLIAWNAVLDDSAESKKNFSLRIPTEGNEVSVIRKQVNENYANPWGLWKDMGRPRFPDRQQVRLLRDASSPFISSSVRNPENDILDLPFTLDKNEVTLIRIADRKDESETYWGLDDAKIPGY